MVNYKSMTIHAVSFSMYIIAIIVQFYFNFVYINASSETKVKATRNNLLANLGVRYTSFVAQLCLIWIFLQFREKDERDSMRSPKSLTESQVNDLNRYTQGNTTSDITDMSVSADEEDTPTLRLKQTF